MPPWLSQLLAVFGDDAARMGSKAGREAFMSRGFLRGAPFGKSLKSGWSAAVGGYAMLQLPLAFYAAGQTEREHKLSTFASSALPFVGTGLATAAFGGLPGMAVGLVLDPVLKETVGKGLQALHDFGRNSSRLNTGGNYRDTQVACTMRQAAVQEMSHSLLNARQYLGREAAYLHA
jgi:hypothetical protein